MSESLDRSVELSAGESERRQRFEALCLPFKTDLYRFIFWLCRNRSLTEDVMQETLLRAWRSIGSLGEEKAVRSWLFTIARRELARTFERKQLETIDLDTALESGDAALIADSSTEVNEMRAALLQLDESYREPLMMQVLFGYSTEEIATHMELSVPAVLTRLYRARHLLRRKMLGEAPDESRDDELP
jgi:RNA polymerase sigma-70 factor (ECF subfamily)